MRSIHISQHDHIDTTGISINISTSTLYRVPTWPVTRLRRSSTKSLRKRRGNKLSEHLSGRMMDDAAKFQCEFTQFFKLFNQFVRRNRISLSIWIQHSRDLECAPLSNVIRLGFPSRCSVKLLRWIETHCPSSWRWQTTVVARGSRRYATWIRTIAQIVHSKCMTNTFLSLFVNNEFLVYILIMDLSAMGQCYMGERE